MEVSGGARRKTSDFRDAEILPEFRRFSSEPPVLSGMSRKLLTEFIGTFFLVLTIGLVVSANSATAVIAIGIVLMVMVYMGGHVSGGHYNPAVSTAALLCKKMTGKEYGPYVLVQIVGAVAAAFASYYIGFKTGTIIIIYNLHFLIGNYICRIHQILINCNTAHVVQLGLRYFSPVKL